MEASAKIFVILGAVNAFLAVGLGAFGAHGLRAKLTPDLLAVYKTGVEYHFYHALGLLAVGLIAQHLPQVGLVRASGWTMLVGILIFSGTLYLLSITGVRWLGAITPIGGTAFLISWGMLVWAVARS